MTRSSQFKKRGLKIPGNKIGKIGEKRIHYFHISQKIKYLAIIVYGKQLLNMHQTKLIQTLRLVPNHRYQKLRQFIKGHCADEKIIELFNLLLQYRPVFDHNNLTKEKVGKALFKDQWPGKASQLNRLNNELKNLIEQYLVWIKLVDDKNRLNALGQYLLLDQVKLNYSIFSKKAAQINRSFKLNPTPSSTACFQTMAVNRDLFFHIETDKYQKEVAGFHLYEESLEIGYLIEQMRILNEKQIRQQVVSFEESTSLNAIFDKAKPFLHILTIRLYHQLLHLQQSFDTPLFESLKTDFFDGFEQLEAIDQRNFMTKLIILANRQFEQGKLHWIKEIFALYRFSIEKGLILYQNQISSVAYINIISIAASLQEHMTWAIKFSEGYKKHLPFNLKEDCYLLGQAHINYFQNNLEQALEKHYASNFREHPTLGLRYKTLEIWLKYEQKDAANAHFLTALDSFRKYLENHKELKTNRKLAFQNLIQLSRQLYAFRKKPGNDQSDIEKLEKTIRNTHPLFSRLWLMSKVNELKTKIQQPDP